jgi:hypothetical protein
MTSWKLKSALAMMLTGAGVAGLAWSQAPTRAVRPHTQTERIMTVHEGGRGIRCRVLQSWRLPSGALAHQLQALETAEMITIVEDGPATMVPSEQGQVRALPMRIYHWGLQATRPPAGSPEPPMLTDPTPKSAVATPMPRQAVQPVAARAPTPKAVAPATPAAATTTPAPSKSGASAGAGGERTLISDNCWSPPKTAQAPVITNATNPTPPLIASPGERLVLISQETRPGEVVAQPPAGETVIISEQPVRDRAPGLFNKPAPLHVVEGDDPARIYNIPAPKTVSVPSAGSTSVTPTFSERIRNTFTKQPSPVKSAGPVRPADVKPVELPTTLPKTEVKQSQAKLPDVKLPEVKLPAANLPAAKLPFTTATASAPTKPAPLSIPAANPVATPPTPSKADTAKPSTQTAKSDAMDWRKMWGKQEGVLEQPGLSTVEKEKVRPDLQKGLPPVSQSERKSADILLNPEKFIPNNERTNPQVPASIIANIPSPLNQPKTAAAKLPLPVPQQLPTPAMLPAPTTQHKLVSGPTPMPLGVQSVLAAKSGAPGPVMYIPVPVATVPEPIRAPVPPEPQVPEPPNPTHYVNAFTPPQPPPGQQQMAPGMPGHMAMQRHPMMPSFPMHPGYMTQPPMHPGYMMQPPYAPPQTAQLIPMMPGNAPMTVSYPANYNGPQAPNPFAQQRAQLAVQPVSYNQAMDRRSVAVVQAAAQETSTLAQLVMVLQTSPYPAQREWAATNMSTFDWRVHPELTQVLIQAARQDSAPTVRAAAVYSLSRLNAQTEPVLSTLQSLRGDADPRVRQEVEQALGRMGLAQAQR